MLQNKFMIARPDEWIEKNLSVGKDFVKIDKIYFKSDRLDSLATQLASLIKAEGYVELSQVLPVDFGDT